ncbi:MAG TPA: hypothetical protein DD490_20260 [Acidobacteria bacterium]|nr:hypothetical protein [Acidobacteriota bacterium]
MTRRQTPLLLLAALLAAGSGPSFAEDGADLLLQHGVFYPVQPAGRVEASLAARDGRIVFLGSDAEAARFRGPRTRVVDLAGRTVTPGLIDAHSHLLGLGRALAEVDLTAAPTYDEVIRRVRDAAARAPRGSWVFGRGWDQNLWPGQVVRVQDLERMARSLFLEKEVGSLEVGKRADLVVFARDIMTVPEAEIPQVAIEMTVVDGEIVHERGRTP